MKMKWRDTHTQFDGEPSGGEVGPSNTTETDGGQEPAAPETSTQEAPETATPTETATVTAPAEPGPVEFPETLKSVFIPRQQGPSSGYQQPQPSHRPPGAAPPAPPQRPTADMWTMEPEKAAAMQEAFMEHKINQGIQEATRPVNEIRERLSNEQRQKFQNEAHKAATVLPKHYEQVLNRDKDFRAKPELQTLTNKIMGEFVAEALNQGSLEDIEFVQTAKFARRSLAIAKADLEDEEAMMIRPTGGPSPVGPQGMKSRQGPILDEETERGLGEASKWAGKEYTPEMVAKALDKFKDSDW